MNDYYVYIYLDPRKPGKYTYENICLFYKPFYVGKGKGRRLTNKSGRNIYTKRIINKIENLGVDLMVYKHTDGLLEGQALKLEREIINNIGLDNLTNCMEGGLKNFRASGKDNPNYGKKASNKCKEVNRKRLIGKTYEEIYGKEMSKRIKERKCEFMNSFRAAIPERCSGLGSLQVRFNACRWFWMYFLITSKGAPPVDTTKYPADQRVLECFPQYGKAYLSCKYEEDRAFSAPIILPRLSCGVVSKRKCMWSSSPFISEILTDICLAISGRVKIKSWRMC